MNRDKFDALVDDLVAEEDVLDAVVAALDDAGWSTPTPAEGWDVHDQVAHLAASEDWSRRSLTAPDTFRTDLAALVDDPARRAAEVKSGLLGCRVPEEGVLAWWRDARTATVAALREHDPRDRVPWFGPDMSVISFTTARLMETWAHGQDVVDALATHREPTRRIRHVAEIGVRTRPFVYASRGLTMPDAAVRVELTGPDGEPWVWGPGDASDRIAGDALDWCLVVTQRRNPADTALTVEGDAAREWIGIAQAFAGAPTDHRPPRAA
ncbi:MAG TPA: TIGR03084 family metal-binding protein [Acidimicrobiia bacterium]